MEVTPARLAEVLASQREAFRRDPYPSLQQRKAQLSSLKKLVFDNREALASAIDEDFGGRSREETILLEVMQVLHLIAHIRPRLRRWMRPSRRAAGMLYAPAKARLHYQPLGVVGIISPWNYPIDLALAPLVCALAAGNRVMLKPSEHTPRTSALLSMLLGEVFDQDHVCVFPGEVDVGIAFAKLPFDHLMFTGSTSIGRSVMARAAENLTPVTLELGGKSPCIVGPEANIAKAANRICFGKTLNSGQTCIAPDHVFVPNDKVRSFVAEFSTSYSELYPGSQESKDHSSVINDAQFARLQEWLADARAKGAEIFIAGEQDEWSPTSNRRMPPHLVLNVSDDMLLMQHEVFGPLLPIVPYDEIGEVIAAIAAGERPLALYYFGGNRRVHTRLLRETHSGGVVINDTSIQFGIKSLPFGGVGASGIGSYHGREGFLTFSHSRAVVSKGLIDLLPLGHPPYGGWIHRLIERIFVR